MPRNGLLVQIGEQFEELMDLTLWVTALGLVGLLVLFLSGKITEDTWMRMTTIFYEGGLVRMWALVAAAIAPVAVKGLFAFRQGAADGDGIKE